MTKSLRNTTRHGTFIDCSVRNTCTEPTQIQLHAHSFDIPRDDTAPTRTRRGDRRPRRPRRCGADADVKLLVSELITNSVKYGGDGAITLTSQTDDPQRLRVEVIDQGAGFVPAARDRPATEVGGWGLHLVQTLADRWGVYEGSTHVWFEIDRRAPGRSGLVERTVPKTRKARRWRALRGTRPLS